MTGYYLHNGAERTGPYSIEELKAKNIKKNVSVWTEGMKDWTTAENVPELKSVFRTTPPPFSPTSQTEKLGNKVGRSPLIILTVIAVGLSFICMLKTTNGWHRSYILLIRRTPIRSIHNQQTISSPTEHTIQISGVTSK